MKIKLRRPHLPRPQYFSAHETKRLESLEGLRLASFRARGCAILLDLLIAAALTTLALFAYFGHGQYSIGVSTGGSGSSISLKINGVELGWMQYVFEFGIPVLYWGLLTYFFNGRTPGKWVAGIRVASTSHDRIRFWQSIERALGYSVSALELGLGFIQYFYSTNRQTSHDRLAETVVICDNNRRLFRKL